MIETLAYTGLKIETNTEYTPDGLEAVLSGYGYFCHVDEKEFVCGRGYRKSHEQRYYEKLSSMHKEVIDNLESIHGALLRMNRSIQAEGTFGIMKYDRWYKRTVRRGLDSVRLELFLVSIGHNLYKYHNKQMRLTEAA